MRKRGFPVTEAVRMVNRHNFGDTQMHGPESLRFFTKVKTISARWPSGIREGAVFAIPTAGS